MRKYATTFLLATMMAATAAGSTLVITPSGYYNLTIDGNGVPSLVKFDDVVNMSDSPPVEPTDPTDPAPTSLEGKVRMWATEVRDPKTAEAQGLMVQMVAEQGERGTFTTKARMAEFTKAAIPRTLSAVNSDKEAEWLAVWDDKIWPEIRRIEAAGQMNTVDDMVVIWGQIADGFKGSMQATWQVQLSTVDGTTSLVLSGAEGNRLDDRPILKMILQMLMQFLLDWLSKNPFGAS